MRHLFLTAIITICATSASAASIEVLASGNGDSKSVVVMSCANCPALKQPTDKTDYIVPNLEAGTQKIEVVDRDGERKLLRTEAWMGGSPVLFISKAPAEAVQAADAAAPAEDTTVAVDVTAKTSALDGDAARRAAAASVASSREFDPAGFELRVN